MAKMTLEKAREIRRLAGQKPVPVPRKQLAADFGISVSLVGKIIRGDAYPEISELEVKRQQLIGYLGDTYEPEDDESIEEYCQIHVLQQRMLTEIENQPMTSEHTNKFGATNDIKNPLLGEIKAYSARKTSILVALGLTRKQRLRMGSGPGEEDDEFDSL